MGSSGQPANVVPGTVPAVAAGHRADGRVRSGAVPPLAECYTARPESGPAIGDSLPCGRTVVLTSPGGARQAPHDWPGGTGKTQAAVHLAESAWQARKAELLAWIPAGSRASVLAGYAATFAQALGTGPAGDTETVAGRFLAWLAHASQPWLLVLDDVADAASLDGLWPAGPNGHVVITTRGSAAPAGVSDPLVCPVGVYSSREALAFLMARLTADPDQRVGAVDLVEDLGREPLALGQAAATIASSELTCRDYRDLYARRRDQIAEVTGTEPAPKAVTWTLSVEHADRLTSGRLAQSCLAFAALLDCHGIPGSVFTTEAACDYVTAHRGATSLPDSRHTQAALVNLERAGLLTVRPADPARTVRVHPAVQAAVRAATPVSMHQAAARAAASALLQAWPADGDEAGLHDAFRSCTGALQQAAAEALWQEGCPAVAFHAGQSLENAGLTGAAVAHWQSLTEISERMLGHTHADTLTAADRLARASLAAGLGDQAVALYQRTLNARAIAFGPDHPATIAARSDLGRALLGAARPADAIDLLEGVLSACELGPGIDDLDALAVQDSLAAAFQAAGRHGDAVTLGRDIVAERERRHGPEHLETAASRACLARAHLAAGQYKDAIGQFKRALTDTERALGPDHPETIAAVSTLASACHSARRLRDALPLYERALRDTERVLGPDHPDTIGARGNLASAYHSAGRMASAVPLYERCRADCERVLGARHPDTLAARANLGHAYWAMGRQTEALEILRAALTDCEQVLAPGDALTAAVRDSLEAVTNG